MGILADSLLPDPLGRADLTMAVRRPRRYSFGALFDASRELARPEERRNARLMAATTLALAWLTLGAAAQTWFFAPDPIRRLIAPTLFAGGAAHLLGYLVSRSRAWRASVALTVVTLTAIPWGICVGLGRFDAEAGLQLGAWLALPALMAAALASPRGVLALGGGAGVILVATFVAGGAGPDVFMHPLTLLVSVTVFVAVATRHRSQLEALRQRELRARNDELDRLRKSLERRVVERTRDLESEHARVERAYEALAENHRALVTSEKMAAIGRLTAGIAHEMASPLAAAMASAHELGSLVDEYDRSIGDPTVGPEDHKQIVGEMREMVGVVVKASEQSASFVRSIKSHTPAHGTQTSARFDPRAVVRDVIQLLGHAARSARCTVSFESTAEAVELLGVPSRFAQAVRNLLHNAIDATGERGGGPVALALAPEGGAVVVTVSDEGPGIPDEVMGRIFEPLFTTKPFGKGTGLGLAITKEVVEAEFGGKVEVSTSSGRGARFTIRLPRPEQDASHGT